MKSSRETPDAMLLTLQESLRYLLVHVPFEGCFNFSKYKFMMNHLEQRQKAIMGKIPEIKKSLEAVKLLKQQKVICLLEVVKLPFSLNRQ